MSIIASSLFASSDDVNGGAAAAILIVFFAIFVLVLAGMWKIFSKAGEGGWKSIIPFYNVYTLLKIVGRPGWWLILFLIPFVNFIVTIVVVNDLSKSFGKGIGYTLGLLFLSPIFVIVLGFGSARYLGPAAQATVGPYGAPPPPPPPVGTPNPPPPPSS